MKKTPQKSTQRRARGRKAQPKSVISLKREKITEVGSGERKDVPKEVVTQTGQELAEH